jgi:hypothetical protein
MLEWSYPMYDRNNSGGSTALPLCSAWLVAGLLGEASGEQVGDALHLFAGHLATHRLVWCTLWTGGAMCLQSSRDTDFLRRTLAE